MSSHPSDRNAKAVSLKSLFPTVDLAVIESVLEAHGGSEDRAVESLLALTDESFVPESRPDLNTTDDASYARALALEEEEQAAAQAARYAPRPARSPSAPSEPAFDPTNLPYQARVRRAPGGGGRPSTGFAYEPQADYGQSTRDAGGVQEQQGPGLEEQFQKLAVSGKKTFDGFMTSGFVKNLKQKVADVQGGISGGPAAVTSHQQGQASYHDEQTSSSGRPSTPSRASSASSFPAAGPQTQNADFPASDWAVDPAPPARSSSAQAQIHINPSTPVVATAPPFPPTTSSGLLHSSTGSVPGGKRSDELIRNAQTGGRQSPSSSMLGTSPINGLSTSPGNKIDFAKLGLLPRQKISLDGRPASPSNLSSSPSNKTLSSAPPPEIVRKIQPAQQKKSGVESDDDDDLGYTKSPFDD